MKFKIGDKVYLREDSRWNSGSASNPIGVVGIVTADNYDMYSVAWSNGIHNSEYEDHDLYSASEYSGHTDTDTYSDVFLAGFTQLDYDEMQDRIELLEVLLVEANNKLEFYENLVNTVKSYTKKEGV